ncbi:hemopexin repeat-containing protein [Streptomyces sp. NPDC002809]|uniref:hemopexin repeat-containing protein n=1 Tax=Streptomyces sp. NPDC002809 TaxID=3154433 RepID=UPI00332705AE
MEPLNTSYFASAGQVAVFDWQANTVTESRPLGGFWGGLPSEFAAGIDAAVDLGTGLLYVFRGPSYVRIPIAGGQVDEGYPLPFAGMWPGVGFDAIDAAMNWGDGKLYFFRGSQYARYDIAADRQDPGYPKEVSAGWQGVDPGWVAGGVDGAVNTGSGRAYLFKGGEYVALDWNTKSQVPGYPLAVADQWPGVVAPVEAAWSLAAGRPAGGTATTGAADFYDRYHAFAEPGEAQLGVPALTTLGQAALESDWGRSAPGNNFFGIKAKAADPEDTRQLLRTREVLRRPDATFPEVVSVTPRPDGTFEYIVRDWFRRYASPEESFTHHAHFLRDNTRYAAAFDHSDDPYAFARAVAAAGYATDPHYSDVLAARMRQIEAGH